METRKVAVVCVGEISLHTALLAIEPFRVINRLRHARLFDIDFVAMETGVVETMVGIPLSVKGLKDYCEAPKFVFVLAAYADDADHKALFSWLRKAHKTGAMIIGVDYGPILMAEAGLLLRQKATSHWTTLSAFEEGHPDVTVVDRPYMIDETVATCAGHLTVLDLSLRIIQSLVPRTEYQSVLDELLYFPIDRSAMPQRSDKSESTPTSDPNIIKAVRLMETHVEDPLTLPEIAEAAGLSLRKLQRKFRGHYNTSAGDFYRNLRLTKATGLLAYSTLSVREIGIATGFSDPSSFYRAFREKFGKGPREMRARFNDAPAKPDGRRLMRSLGGDH